MGAFRITRDRLEQKAKMILDSCGFKYDPQPWKLDDAGVMKAAVGTVHLAKQHHGWTIVRMVNEHGGAGTVTPSWQSLTAAEMWIFLEGMEAAHRQMKQARS